MSMMRAAAAVAACVAFPPAAALGAAIGADRSCGGAGKGQSPSAHLQGISTKDAAISSSYASHLDGVANAWQEALIS